MSLEQNQHRRQEAILQPYPYLKKPFLNLPPGIVSGAICRIEAPEHGNVLGTGFLIASRLIITNFHVVEAVKEVNGIANQAAQLVFRFGYHEWPTIQPGITVRASATKVIKASSESHKLDYALIQLADVPFDEDGKRIHSLPLDLSRAIVLEEEVNIIQHPEGDASQIAFGRVKYVEGDYFQYDANTEGGSSGSPVFDTHWQVIGLHRGSGPDPARTGTPEYGNEGVVWHAIWPEIRSILEQAWREESEEIEKGKRELIW